MADSPTPAVNATFALTVLSYLIILSRTLFQRLKHETFKPDDYLMLVSTVIYAAYTGTFIVAAYHGTNISQTNLEHWREDQIQYVVIGSKSLLISRIFYLSYLWMLKACLLIYCYLRLPLRTNEVLVIKVAAGILAVTWVVCFVTFFVECIPIDLYWNIIQTPPQCARAPSAVIVTEATNILTDLILMAIPLRILLRPIPPPKELLRLIALYAGGILVIIASFVRAVAVLSDLLDQHELIWGQIECFLATVFVNAPVLHGIYRHGCNHVRTWKFGKDHCETEYQLARETPTRNSTHQRSEEQHLEHDGERTEPPPDEEGVHSLPQRGERKSTRMSDQLRKSISVAADHIKRLSYQVRSSFDIGGIEWKVELVQETKHDPTPPGPPPEDPNGFDIYTGPPPLELAHVSSRATGGGGPGQKHKHHFHPRFGRFKRNQRP